MAKKKSKQTKAPKKVAKEVPVEAPKKKKKKHTGLKVFAILMTIFVVFPIAFVFIAFFDTSTKKVSAKDIHYENLVSQTFYNAVSGLIPDEQGNCSLDFTINEEMFDGIMMAACDKVNQKQFIPKMYCYVNKNHYNFVVDLQASFFKTRVQLQTTLDSDGQYILVFKINQIVLGRLPIPTNWITGIAGNFIKDEMLDNVFAQSGFRIKSDLAHARLTYARKDFREDVGTYVSRLAGDNNYLNLLLNVVENNREELFATNYDGGVTASINLGKLKLPVSKDYNPPLHFTQLDEHKEIVTSWLTKNYLGEQGENVGNIFNYLIRGYDEKVAGVKEYIDGIDEGSSFGKEILQYINSNDDTFTTLEDYTGSYIDENKSIHFKNWTSETISASFTPDGGNLSATFSVGDSDINKYLGLQMSEAIGKTIPITYKDSDGAWGFEYIVVDNLFLKFPDAAENPTMIMYFTLNISGLPITISLTYQNIDIQRAKGDNNIGKLALVLDENSIKFGSAIPISSDMLSSVFDMLPTGDDGYFVYDKNNKQFLLNLDSILGDFTGKEIVIGILNNDSGFTCTKSSSNNKLEITYTKTNP